MPHEPPFITVVMPVRNERPFIGSVLDEILGQDYPPDRMEVLVCDGMSTDGTRELVLEYAATDPRVRLLDNPRILSSAGRNVGFRAGRGDFFLVIDGHTRIANPGLLRAVADAFLDTGADCLGRPQPLLSRAEGSFSEAVAIARATPLGHDPRSLIYSSYEGFAPPGSNGAAYARHVFDRVGYVDESFDACEDLEFNTRIEDAGLRCWTSPRLAVGYFARDTWTGLFRQMLRYGCGRFLFLRKHPHHVSLPQLLPALLVGIVPAALLGALLRGPVGALLAAPALLYALAVAAYSVVLASRTRWRHLPRFLAIFPAIHLGIGLGFLLGMIRGRCTPLGGSRDVAGGAR